MLPPGPSSIRTIVRWLATPLPYLDELAGRYGNVFSLTLPALAPRLVVFSDPSAIRELFAGDPSVFKGGEANVVLRAIVGDNSLLVLDGDRHLRERRLMLPPFHGERMKAYGEAMREVTNREIDRWPIGRVFPVHASTQAITLGVIIRTIFGVDGNDPSVVVLRDALLRWLTLLTSRVGTAFLLMTPPVRAIQLQQMATRGLGKLLPWAPIVRAQLETDRLVRDVIAARRRAGTDGRTDILSMLIDARDESGGAMTDDELRDEMLTLLIAGHETTATAIAWVLHHLLENPHWLARVRAEVREVGPTEVAKLVLLEAAIKEALRLTPIVPFVGRLLGAPTTICGVDMPAGTGVVACIYLVHRRADLYPDPLRFDPSRFLGTKVDPATYFPFGGGVRRCLGMAFANYEMKIVLANILARVDLAPAPGKKVRPTRRAVTFAPSGGMPILVTRRD
jgi:cytochrome P450